MIFETVRSEGLAHFSYVIGDEEAGVCAVIDPRRDVDIYLDLARRHESRITHILETHTHADFVSGSCELAVRTNAPIYVGAEAGDEYDFEHCPLHDGDAFELGVLRVEVLHTPGHTPEHICFLVSGGSGAPKPWGLFSGDTLFAGEVGRPDLLGEEQTKALAPQLFDSLHDRVLPLGDDVVIYPSHGEGSPCGASIGARRLSTIGYERRNNPHLQIEDRDTFVREILEDLESAPAYYARMKVINAEGPPVIGARPYAPPLTAAQFFETMQAPHTIAVDVRSIEAFASAHVPGSLNIGLREAFPIWAGRLLDPILNVTSEPQLHEDNQLLLILSDSADLPHVQSELLQIGYDNVAGYLQKGFRTWSEAACEFASMELMSVQRLKEFIEEEPGEIQLLDVRSAAEWQEGHVPTATHIHLPDLLERHQELDPELPTVVYCGSGYRASMACSLLKREGFQDVHNVPGSISAWEDAGYPLE
ncbi:MAG TPA: rhodanese-like domain-containing protein [Candidatus Sulfomarinibacteraceae bacterium]|nr:rhodanese-like domain-containing protein [Candidatus Sulfomarinibacteraceae bacterium]